MKRIIAFVLIFSFMSEGAYAAIFKAECLNAKGKMNDCKLNFENEDLAITFASSSEAEMNKTISGNTITRISAGEYARRRVGESIGSTILLGPLMLFTLFSKKKRDTFGVEYTKADGKTEVALIQVKKKYGVMVASSLKAISGKNVEYEAKAAK